MAECAPCTAVPFDLRAENVWLLVANLTLTTTWLLPAYPALGLGYSSGFMEGPIWFVSSLFFCALCFPPLLPALQVRAAPARGAGAAAEPMLRAAARSPSLAALGLEGHTAGRSAHCPA